MSKATEAEAKLTNRQLKVIPFIVGSPTYADGCKNAKINKTTLYKWLKDPEFKTELDRQRNQLQAEAFGILCQSLTKAVETLVSLLDNKDDRLKRLTAKDVIDFIVRHKENEDLDKRLTEVEKLLSI
ncbi:MAG: phBC6A51 family helix-turn-helix protein [Planctomycetota bacterium]